MCSQNENFHPYHGVLNVAFAKSTVTIDDQTYHLDCRSKQEILIVKNSNTKTSLKTYCGDTPNALPTPSIDIKKPNIPTITSPKINIDITPPVIK